MPLRSPIPATPFRSASVSMLPREEGHQQIDHRLDQRRKITRQTIDDFNQEQHDGINDLRCISRQGREDTGNQL